MGSGTSCVGPNDRAGVYYRDSGQLELSAAHLQPQETLDLLTPAGLLLRVSTIIILSRSPSATTEQTLRNMNGMLSPHFSTPKHIKLNQKQARIGHITTRSQRISDKKFQTKSTSIVGLSFTKDKHYTVNIRENRENFSWILLVIRDDRALVTPRQLTMECFLKITCPMTSYCISQASGRVHTGAGRPA